MPHRNPEVVHHYNKGTALLHKKKYDKALQEFKKAMKLGGICREAYLNMGNCYKFTGNDRLAYECYLKANHPDVPYLDTKLRGEYGLALNNIGLYHFMYDRNVEALKTYDIAIKNNPEFYDALWNKATAALKIACSGHPELFPMGWELYGNRFTKTPPVTLKNDKPMMPWDGSYVDSLVVMAEQGIGDNIMWGRYLSLLLSRVGTVWVQCNQDMIPLFTSIPGIRVCSMPSSTDATACIPMCELSRFFLDGVPPPGEWLADKFTPHSFPTDKPNIGIVFAGSTTHANDAYRSIPMHRFHRFSSKYNLYCLTPGFTSTKHIKSLNITDWASTASYILGLDLVISIDTSVVHLAGSLGAPTWMLQPYKETDFRWGCDLMGSRNVWYSSVSIYRNPQDWDHVFSCVAEDLEDRFG